MPEFKPLQTQLQQARKDRETGENTVFRAKEKLKKLKRAEQQLSRSVSENSEVFQALLQQKKNVENEISVQKSWFAESLKAEESLLKAFLPFTDPRQHLRQFSDDFPVLLSPVRLETRFKEVSCELWVRIFPDDCSIDTFDDTLSEAEVTKAQNYWTNRWKAGKAGNETIKPFIHNKEKGAWRELMGILNAGRAYWITQNYRPVNGDDIPERNSENDVLLIIPTEELPDQTTQDALKDYWGAIVLANGDAQKSEAAFTGLVTATGGDEEHALQLITTYKPQNVDEERPETDTLPDVSIAFLVFPKSQEIDTKLTQWSRAARVTTFPDKFVLLGFQKGNSKPVIEKLGNRIPDPLIVGPDPGEDIEEVLKAEFGDDFENLPDEKKAAKYVEYLSERSDTKWLFDFDEAVRIGMGFKIDLSAFSEQEYNQGFERLFVLGVKLSADEEEGQSALEQLIQHHHFGDSGFSILPQGIPTNNTEDSRAGYSETEDADEAYLRYKSEVTKDDPTDRAEKRDGRWLAELLGIDIKKATLHLTANYYHKDQCEARAMNTALWNATIGYFMESMLTPLFSDRQRNLTRWFFVNHVSGRGRVPAIRIGNQPYGILPVTTISDLQWLSQADTRFTKRYADVLPFLNGLYTVLQKVKADWESFVSKVAYVGKEDRDRHKILLEALGLHATSVKFDQRYGESFQHLFNKLKLQGILDPGLAGWIERDYKKRIMYLLEELGYERDEESRIPILEKFFLTKPNNVTKLLIDDRPLSETKGIRAYTDTDSGQNYIEWLIENAKNNHLNIARQEGFIDNKKPNTLLYEMLRHALNLEFLNSGLKLYLDKNFCDFNAAQVDAARIDKDFIGIRTQKPLESVCDWIYHVESKWEWIYREETRTVGQGDLLVDHISNLLKTDIATPQTEHLHEVIAALEHLKDTPTARLERAFVEHLDCCTYRLDAWLLGFVNLQLYAMRYGGESNQGEVKKGLYLGAYGWVENLKPEDKTLTPVKLEPELQKIFDPTGENVPMKDDKNAGYVHAPSISQALTAAVLRNAYISNASKDEADSFKVNLSSERMRMALSIIEGMQQGQSLGALLGYQLERGLHDRTDEELDIYIYELRKVFPLVSNCMTSTEIKEGKTASSPEETQRFQEEEKEFEKDKAITKIEARNVVNGLSLLERIKKTGIETYPFGFPIGKGASKLKFANGDQKKAINAEVQRLMNIRDAVADLAMAESVHQIVQGNYDRAAGALDTYSKGNYPQTPDVIQTPGSGISLTHRFGIHLPSSVSPDDGTTPRSKAEPAVNAWLKDIFPNLSDIGCRVEYRIPNYEDGVPHANQGKTVTMANLGLRPIDLLYMLDVESEKNLTALDDGILKFVHQTDTPRPDVELEIQYTNPGEAKISFFEMAPLVRSLRSLVVAARPLLPSDMMLQSEAVEEQNASCFIHPDRIKKVKQIFDNIRIDLENDFLNFFLPFIGYEIRLMSVDDVSDIPAGDARLVIVAKHGVENRLHFRIFDADGTKIVDKSETEFPDKSTELETFKSELANLWDQELTIDQKRTVIDAIRSITGHTPLIDPEDFEITMGKKDLIIEHIDALLGHFIHHLHRLNQFGMPQTGFGFIYDRKSAIYTAIYKKVLEYKKRWEEKNATFADLMNNQFPAAVTDEEKISILQKAERTISTEYSIPVPTVMKYLEILNGSVSEVGKKELFDNKFNELETFLSGSFLSLKDLVDEVDNLNSDLKTFDLLTIEMEDEERQIVVFAEDLKNQAEKLNTMILEKSTAVQALLGKHDASAVTKEKKVQVLTQAAKILFGEDFQMVPEFNLSAEQGSELQNCLDNQNQLLDFQMNDQLNDFPVDEWLYGMARVREKLSAWENLVMLAEGFNKDRSPLNLTPIQLPFNADDSWFGLAYREKDFEIEGDKLLYTAYLPNFNPAQPQCGLLVDEWTEVIPAKKETTGLTFHYDRPNPEPPQTLLLVTPSEFTGSWKWEDLVTTLHETLDLAKLRALEPDHIDQKPYAQLLPATIAAVTRYPVTMMLNYVM